MGWGMDLLGWAWMGIWILALLAMAWLIARGSDRSAPLDDAHGILRGRFARGEINQQEYERARDALAVDARRQQGETRP